MLLIQYQLTQADRGAGRSVDGWRLYLLLYQLKGDKVFLFPSGVGFRVLNQLLDIGLFTEHSTVLIDLYLVFYWYVVVLNKALRTNLLGVIHSCVEHRS